MTGLFSMRVHRKLLGALSVGYGTLVTAVGSEWLKHGTVAVQALPAPGGAAGPAGVTLNPNQTAIISLIATGVLIIGGQVVNLVVTLVRGIKAADNESESGKRKHCEQQMEQLKLEHLGELARIDQYRKDIVRDYEARIAGKVTHIQFLSKSLDEARERERAYEERIQVLVAQVVQFGEANNKVAQEMAANNRAAIRRIPLTTPDPDTDPDLPLLPGPENPA